MGRPNAHSHNRMSETMTDKPQLLQSIPGEFWAAIGAVATGFAAWIAKKLYEVALEKQLVDIHTELKDQKLWQQMQAEVAKREIETLKVNIADLRTAGAERKAQSEAQQRTLERILDRLERNDK